MSKVAGSLANRIRKNPWMGVLCVFFAFILWQFPLGILQSWSAIEQKTVPQWLADSGWPRLKYLLLAWYGLFVVMFGIALIFVVRACRGSALPIVKDVDEGQPTVEAGRAVVTEASIPKPKTVVHKNLHDLFRTDFKRVTTLHTGYEFNISNQVTGEQKGKVPCELEVLLDLDGRAYFIALYVPQCQLTFEICKAFIDQYPAAVKQLRNEVGVEGGIVGERRTSFKELTFTKRIYIYHEMPLMQEQEDKLYALYTKKKLSLILRGKQFEYDANNPRPIPVPVEAIQQPSVSVERLMELRNQGAAIANEITTRHVTSPYDTQAKEWSAAVESYLNTQNARTWALEFNNPAMDIHIPLGANETTANTRQLVKWIKTRLVRLNALIERAQH